MNIYRMAARTYSSKTRVGILAEDQSDVAVLKSIIKKWSREATVDSFAGRGSGKLRKNARAWADSLSTQGCKIVFLVHDSDDADPRVLRKQLERCFCQNQTKKRVVIIPVTEIEAWLVADVAAVKESLNFRHLPKAIGDPERLRDPKRTLSKWMRQYGVRGRDYVSSIDNPRIAECLDVNSIRRCTSFRIFADHLDELFGISGRTSKGRSVGRLMDS